MLTKEGVMYKNRIGFAYEEGGDTIYVTIIYKERREGMLLVSSDKTMTFKENAKEFIPEISPSWDIVKDWLEYMGVDECVHAFAIDAILTNCKRYLRPSSTLYLDLEVELWDSFCMQRRQRPRDFYYDDVDEEEETVLEGLKRMKITSEA